MKKINAFIKSSSFKSLSIQLFSFFLSFLISILITNIFNAEIYGDYILVFSTVDMLAVFSLFGYNQLFSIEIPKIKSITKKLSLYNTALKSTLINSVIISFLFICFSWYYPFKSEEIGYFIIGAALILPFVALTLLNTNFLFSLKEVIVPQVNDKIIRVLLFITIFITLSFYSKSINVIIIAFIISSISAFIISYILRKRKISTSEPNQKLNNNHLTKSVYLLLIINLLNLIFSKIDGIQIAYYLGAEYSGVNNIYMKLASSITLIMSSTLLIFSPKISSVISQKRYDIVKKEIRKMFKFVIPLALFIGLIIIFLSPFFFSVYKTPLYTIEIKSLSIYSISSFLKILCGPAILILMLSNKLKYLIIGSILELIINISLNCYLIPRWKIEGAAYASLLSELFVNLYFAYICFKLFRLNTLFVGK